MNDPPAADSPPPAPPLSLLLLPLCRINLPLMLLEDLRAFLIENATWPRKNPLIIKSHVLLDYIPPLSPLSLVSLAIKRIPYSVSNKNFDLSVARSMRLSMLWFFLALPCG